MTDHLTIDCDSCIMQGSPTCDDCLVTHLCSIGPDRPVVIGLAEVRALRLISDSGLVPGLRHRRRTG